MSSLHGSKFLVGMPALVLLAAAGSMKLVRFFFCSNECRPSSARGALFCLFFYSGCVRCSIFRGLGRSAQNFACVQPSRDAAVLEANAQLDNHPYRSLMAAHATYSIVKAGIGDLQEAAQRGCCGLACDRPLVHRPYRFHWCQVVQVVDTHPKHHAGRLRGPSRVVLEALVVLGERVQLDGAAEAWAPQEHPWQRCEHSLQALQIVPQVLHPSGSGETYLFAQAQDGQKVVSF